FSTSQEPQDSNCNGHCNFKGIAPQLRSGDNIRGKSNGVAPRLRFTALGVTTLEKVKGIAPRLRPPRRASLGVTALFCYRSGRGQKRAGVVVKAVAPKLEV